MLVKYVFADETVSEVEVDEEIGNFIMDSRREEANLARKERYHCVSYDSSDLRCDEYADSKTVESIIENELFSTSFYSAYDGLTEVQKRRVEMLTSGMSVHEIARIEGVNLSKIQKTITQIQKKLKKFEN